VARIYRQYQSDQTAIDHALEDVDLRLKELFKGAMARVASAQDEVRLRRHGSPPSNDAEPSREQSYLLITNILTFLSSSLPFETSFSFLPSLFSAFFDHIDVFIPLFIDIFDFRMFV
jgi:hypothetical protein